MTKVRGGLGKWFNQKWVDVSRKNKSGKHPKCGASAGSKARAGGKRAYPKCVPASKASSMSKKDKESATRRKRAAYTTKKGAPAKKPKMVKTELLEKLQTLIEKNVPNDAGKWAASIAKAKRKFKVYPSAYANAFAAKDYKSKGGTWRTRKETVESAPGYKHDCAVKVIHKEHGEGICIPEKHTLIKEGDTYVVTHYDVKFKSGKVVEDISVNDLKIVTMKEHWHKNYKKKKKNEGDSVNEAKFYVSYNPGRGMGKKVVNSPESDYEEPRVFRNYNDAEKYVKRAKSSGSSAGRIISYWVSDINNNRIDKRGKISEDASMGFGDREKLIGYRWKDFQKNYLKLNPKYRIANDKGRVYGYKLGQGDAHWMYDADNGEIYLDDKMIARKVMTGRADKNIFEGLWANINKKKKRGEKSARKGSDAYKAAVKAGNKLKKGKSESVRFKFDEGVEIVEHSEPFLYQEAEYQGRTVKLNKPMQGDVKKFKVYVKNEKGNVVKVNFGQKGMNIKKNNPERRKSFRARHNCDNPGPKTKARYWSCRKW